MTDGPLRRRDVRGRSAAAAEAAARAAAPARPARRDRQAGPGRAALDRLRDRDHRRRRHRLRGGDGRDRRPLPARVPGDDGASRGRWRSPPTSPSPRWSLAAHFGTAFNVLLVLAASFPLLFAFGADARHRDGVTVSIGVTLLGIVWIGIPLAHAVLLRDLPDHGAALLIDVLVGTFVADTAAYATGRMFGSHKIAPSISPEQDDRGPDRRLRDRHHGLLVRRPLPGLALRGRRADHRRRRRRGRPGRRPLRVDAEARPRQQGHRHALRPPRRHPRPPRRRLLHRGRRLLPLGGRWSDSRPPSIL